ncbi:hypothetical protein EAS64_04420 [Trebonia kvetii]|uniref:Uncharacterized protein n=1 Tax=Trebonia kvetii TaxID=2480626 RepID=A0A6P2C5B4_9ACTN|nr:hypothetical protein [Trebonia kvetii]TVZ06632.1 hypothetical protein EAS64_04420 [Trebonia kvetii]
MAVAVICQLTVSGSAVATPTAAAGNALTAASGAIAPNQVNELDCNGWSNSYESVRQLAGDLCTDPISVSNGKANRFIDNGWYVGHDEPSTKFISSQPGSGNTMTYLMKMSKDPAAPPTANGSVVDYAQLSVAPWFGLPLCDPKSYPQNPCTPDSDTNSGLISDPNGAGSAFMELQFYPPGYTPFVDSTSCSATKWCAALTIDSLACTFGFATCNGNCIEPVNFAYLQTNGVPSGPPSPQLADVSSFMPNASTLMINPGDELVVSISDPPSGFTTTVTDLTTHRTGFMTASAANGFMNTNIADCSGTPFTFHAEYNSAQQQNQVPWAALEGGVLMQQEIGHGEVCNSVSNQDPFSASFTGGQSYSDPNVYDTCNGGAEGKKATGEGPCNPNTGVCQNATTQGTSGPVACPTNNAASGALCEFADGFCVQQGTRPVVINGVPATESARTNECYQNRFQNGDLDFEGQSYLPDWPNGSGRYPTTFQYAGPFTSGGHTYPQVQFETDVGGSSNLCDVSTGAGCTVPPISAKFYPFWSLSRAGKNGNGNGSAGCVWNFGNDQPKTVADFGGDAQYGTPNVARYGGTIISAPMPNPEFTGPCRA